MKSRGPEPGRCRASLRQGTACGGSSLDQHPRPKELPMGRNVTLGIGTLIIILIIVAIVF
jgi:hypothetical protein